jgi:uncharacterized protein (DUF2126 family)
MNTLRKVQATGDRVISALSQQLGMPEDQVGAVYAEEFARIAAKARIMSYVPVLALRNARAKLSREATQAAA